jgi:hypothetical protein
MPPTSTIAIVTVIMLGNDVSEPGVVLLVCGFPGLPVTQRGTLLCYRGQAHHDEAEFEGHRLLAPERAVVVEDGDLRLRRDEIARNLCLSRDDKILNAALGGSVIS